MDAPPDTLGSSATASNRAALVHTPSGPGDDRSRWWAVAGTLTIAALVGSAVVTERSDGPGTVMVLRAASLGWVSLVVLGAALVLVLMTATHVLAQRVAGLPPSGRRLVRPTLRANVLDLVTRSNGAAGLAAFTADASSRRRPKGATVTADLLAGLAQQLGLAVVAAGAFALMVLDGRLSGLGAVAGVVLLGSVVANVVMVVLALRHQERLRRLVTMPVRIMRTLHVGPVHEWNDAEPADEVRYEIEFVRRSPVAAAGVVLAAIASDVGLAVILWLSLHAVGAEASPITALMAFGVSTLVGAVSFLPAGLGFVEVSAVAVLISSGVEPSRAIAATALYRLAQLWFPLIVGVMASSPADRRRWRPAIRVAAAIGCIACGIAGLAATVAGRDPRPLRIGPTVGDAFRTDRYASVVIGVALCGLGVALWRGKQWAIVAFAGLATAMVWSTPSAQRAIVLPAVVITIAIIALGHQSFRVRTDVIRVRSALEALAVRQVAILVYAIVGLYVLDGAFRRPTTLGDSMADGLRLLFALRPEAVEPFTVDGRIFAESIRVASLASFIGFLVAALAPLILPRSRTDRRGALPIVERYGVDGLAPFVLDDDKDLAIDPQADGLVSYHLTGSVALALGGPIGSIGGRRRALDIYLDRCERNDWIPAFHQVSDIDRGVLESFGFQLHHRGAVAIVPVTDFSLDADHFTSVRSTVRALERRGRRVEELQQPIDDGTMAQLRAVSNSWLRSGGQGERMFTLGRFDPAALRATRVLVVRVAPTAPSRSDARPTDGVEVGGDVDRWGDIEAFVSIFPSFSSPNGNVDLMRHRAGSADGVMDLLFVAMIEMLAREGMTGVDLGFAPAAVDPIPVAPGRVRQLVRRHGDRGFRLDGMHGFEDTWRPRWEHRSVAVRSVQELPQVLHAVHVAGDVTDETRFTRRVATLVRRFPVTAGLGGLIVWLMLATTFDQALHDLLLHTFGLSWTTLSHLEIWRLVTSSLIQAEPGVVRANFVLVLTALPFAEWRLGSRHTLALFWFCDVTAALSVLLSIRFLSFLGSDFGASALITLDAGSSAALYGIVGALLTQLRSPRRRVVALAVVCSVHVGLFIGYGALFDLQHLVASIAGFGLATYWQRRQLSLSAVDGQASIARSE